MKVSLVFCDSSEIKNVDIYYDENFSEKISDGIELEEELFGNSSIEYAYVKSEYFTAKIILDFVDEYEIN